DTVGYATPAHYFKVISHLKQNVPNISRAVISAHCHDDLGLAVANSLSAVEEIVMALRTRGDYFGVGTRINTKRLCATSRLVSSITGMQVQRNKAIVG